jgi:N-acetyl-alpha-D-muramate 1-phosphate uridylyltransferase
MKCLILAAGLGTRLRPLTNKIPKALVPLAGKPLLAILLDKLIRYGCDSVVINTHHHAEQIERFLQQSPYADLPIAVSYESEILDTGGGIKQMLSYLNTDAPVLVHNVDVVSELDFAHLFAEHAAHGADITLAVQSRHTKRYLLFNPNNQLIDREIPGQDIDTSARRLAFNGIHIVTPRAYDPAPSGPFSCIEYYIQLAHNNQLVHGYDIGACYWRDLGKLADLQQTEDEIRGGKTRL